MLYFMFHGAPNISFGETCGLHGCQFTTWICLSFYYEWCYRYNMYIFEYVIVLLKCVRLFLVKPSSGSKCLFKTCTYISGYFIPLGINYCTLPCQVKMAPVQSYKTIDRWSMKPLSEVQSKDSLSIYLSVCLCANVWTTPYFDCFFTHFQSSLWT